MTIYDKTIDEKILFPVGIGILQTETVRNFYNTSDATATPNDILSGKISYGKYGMINGTLDIEGEKNTSYQEGYLDGENEGFSDGYAEGLDDGKIEGREEIIDEQSDANITPDKVSEGFIGYGPNNERIVGTNVGGFDYSVIGYSPAESQALNEIYAQNLNYTKSLYDNWNPSTTDAYAKYESDYNLVIAPNIDTSNVTRMGNMFASCRSLYFVPQLNTSNVVNMDSMFAGCYALKYVPHFDTSNVTNMNSIFTYCYVLDNVPHFDTSNVTRMEGMFSYCQNLKTVPLFNTSKVTNMRTMFQYTSKLLTIPEFDVSNVIDMHGMFQNANKLISIPSLNTIKNTSFYGFLTSSELTSIGTLRCDAVTNMNYFSYFSTLTKLTDVGGFINLGMQSSVTGTNDSYFLTAMPNLTKQSLLNVLNGLYDRASAGMSTLTLKLHNNHKALLSDDELAIATNKGWIIS